MYFLVEGFHFSMYREWFRLVSLLCDILLSFDVLAGFLFFPKKYNIELLFLLMLFVWLFLPYDFLYANL